MIEKAFIRYCSRTGSSNAGYELQIIRRPAPDNVAPGQREVWHTGLSAALSVWYRTRHGQALSRPTALGGDACARLVNAVAQAELMSNPAVGDRKESHHRRSAPQEGSTVASARLSRRRSRKAASAVASRFTTEGRHASSRESRKPKAAYHQQPIHIVTPDIRRVLPMKIGVGWHYGPGHAASAQAEATPLLRRHR